MAKTDKQKFLTIFKQTRENASNKLKGVFIGINALENAGILNFDDEKTREVLIKLCTALVREDNRTEKKTFDKLDNLIASKRYWATKKVTVDDLINYFIEKIKQETRKLKKRKPNNLSVDIEKINIIIDTFDELLTTKKKGKLQEIIEEAVKQNETVKEAKKKK